MGNLRGRRCGRGGSEHTTSVAGNAVAKGGLVVGNVALADEYGKRIAILGGAWAGPRAGMREE